MRARVCVWGGSRLLRRRSRVPCTCAVVQLCTITHDYSCAPHAPAARRLDIVADWSKDAVDSAELCAQTTSAPVPDGYCEDGNSIDPTAALPFDGRCSIPDAMAAECRSLMYTVEDLATEGRSICEKTDGDNAPDMNERICAVLLEGEWLPKSCGQWETELAFLGPAGVAAYCASDQSGYIGAVVNLGLEACCPAGTAAGVNPSFLWALSSFACC